MEIAVTQLTMGLLLNERHREKTWTAINTPRLIDGLMSRFPTIQIEDQATFDKHYDEIDFFFSMEPKWGAPVLDFRNRLFGIIPRRKEPKLSFFLYSDPHIEQWREDYFLKNNISFMLAFYYHNTLYHFKRTPKERIIHFPWMVPDDYVNKNPISYHGTDKILCYGGSQSNAYDLRNWCRTFDFVEADLRSGVENKVLSDEEFVVWLQQYDASIAAGSDNLKYKLTMPKYFEIPASGQLLFAQETDDLSLLGFEDRVNCVIFNRENFVEKAQAYLANPTAYLAIREAGRELILERHTLSKRLDMLEKHIQEYLSHVQ